MEWIKYKHCTKQKFLSIADLKLFSASYSGLEYDYRGLIHVYEYLENFDKMTEFTNKLSEWKILRETNDLNEPEVHMDYAKPSEPLSVTLEKYYAMANSKYHWAGGLKSITTSGGY